MSWFHGVVAAGQPPSKRMKLPRPGNSEHGLTASHLIPGVRGST